MGFNRIFSDAIFSQRNNLSFQNYFNEIFRIIQVYFQFLKTLLNHRYNKYVRNGFFKLINISLASEFIIFIEFC